MHAYKTVQHASNTARQAQIAASRAAFDAQKYKAALEEAQDQLEDSRASNSDLQLKLVASNAELQTYEADLQATKANLDECSKSLEREERLRKEADGAAEVAYEAAHKSGAYADELRHELRKSKGEVSKDEDSHESSTADLALELVLCQQALACLEQMLQVNNPKDIREQLLQNIATTEKHKREKELLEKENIQLKALVEEEQDMKRTRGRKMRKSDS
ncbi:hypothetical protein DIS24_g5926 [Lasiodiplodia hormozganensis]|uniref:Uncharacterized protein n=1 Tax=Lasiodiplodia hormozganensis TaxID=869390 RepID=A0AA39YJR4_9PEZI|nr:hypothetical protein DIS24_g5926 [Lasiodiplodia hormozganensis]